MTIKTPKGAIFDSEKSAKSNLFMVLDGNGKQVMDTLRITGKFTTTTLFMESTAMIEVEHTYGIDEVNEDFLWQ
jgi:hypothetical protein